MSLDFHCSTVCSTCYLEEVASKKMQGVFRVECVHSFHAKPWASAGTVLEFLAYVALTASWPQPRCGEQRTARQHAAGPGRDIGHSCGSADIIPASALLRGVATSTPAGKQRVRNGMRTPLQAAALTAAWLRPRCGAWQTGRPRAAAGLLEHDNTTPCCGAHSVLASASLWGVADRTPPRSSGFARA